MLFSESFGDGHDSYIKLKDVEQNSKGNKFAVAYLDDGKFYLRLLGKENRTDEEIKASELDINAALKLNDHTMPLDGLPDPFINCTFLTDNILYVALFEASKCLHHHFFYQLDSK